MFQYSCKRTGPLTAKLSGFSGQSLWIAPREKMSDPEKWVSSSENLLCCAYHTSPRLWTIGEYCTGYNKWTNKEKTMYIYIYYNQWSITNEMYAFCVQLLTPLKESVQSLLHCFWRTSHLECVRLHKVFVRLFNFLLSNHGQGLWSSFPGASRWEEDNRQKYNINSNPVSSCQTKSLKEWKNFNFLLNNFVLTWVKLQKFSTHWCIYIALILQVKKNL